MKENGSLVHLTKKNDWSNLSKIYVKILKHQCNGIFFLQMSTRTAIAIKKSHTLFDYIISQRPDHAEITIQFFTSFYTTRPVPQTLPLLELMLPRIFAHKCFNNFNRSFKKEAAETELGHLFEHILLEFLCQYKFSEEKKRTIRLKGLTEWNWVHDPKGIFYISLNSTITDAYLLQKALTKTSEIMETILLSTLQTENPNHNIIQQS